MADLAQLGIAVDSSQAERGALALSRLSNAARHAEAATKGVTTGARGAASAAAAISGASGSAAAALTKEANAARQAAAALDMHARAANQNVQGLHRANVGNIAAQLQDVAVSAQMGMGALQIGLQQGTQLAAVIATMENPIRGLGAALLSVISPVSLLTIGIVALVAAGLQMVDWPAAFAAALRMMADGLDAIAPYAAAAAAALGLMFAPALLSGAWALVTAITALGTSAVRAAAAFTVAWLAALGPAGWFFLALGAAAIAIYAFRDELEDILGFDIVDAARRGANALIGVFVGGFRAASLIWEKFPEHMDEIGKMAAWHIGIRIREMLREMIIEVNRFMKGIGDQWGFDAPWIDQNKAIPEYELGTGKAIHPKPQISGAGQAAYDEVGNVFQTAMDEDWIGGLGEGAEWAGGKLRELAGLLGQVDEKGTKKRGKTDADRYQDIVDGADRHIASLLAEQAALGMTEEAAAALRFEQDLLNQAQQRGIELTPQQTGYFKMLAETMAGLEAGIQKAQEAMDFAKDVTRGFIDDFRNGLEQGKGFWESFGNAALGVLDRITDKLLNDVLDALFQVNSAGSGGGGIFGSLLGSVGKIFGFANGGYTGPGGKYEPAGVVHKGEYVFSAAATRALGVTNLDRMHRRAKGYAEGGHVTAGVPRMQAPANSNPAPTYSPTYVIDASGAEAGVEEKIKQALREHDRQSYQRFIRDWSEANKRGVVG